MADTTEDTSQRENARYSVSRHRNKVEVLKFDIEWALGTNKIVDIENIWT